MGLAEKKSDLKKEGGGGGGDGWTTHTHTHSMHSSKTITKDV